MFMVWASSYLCKYIVISTDPFSTRQVIEALPKWVYNLSLSDHKSMILLKQMIFLFGA